MKLVYFVLVILTLLALCIPTISLSFESVEKDNAINSVQQFIGTTNVEFNTYDYELTPHAKYIVLVDKNTEYWVNSDNYNVERYSSYNDLDNSKEEPVQSGISNINLTDF
jgi:hypothetical protein